MDIYLLFCTYGDFMIFNGKFAQSSLEYLVVIALSSILIISGVSVFYAYSENLGEKLEVQQINTVGNDIIENAENIYIMGINSQSIYIANLPDIVTSVEISGYDLIINYKTTYGDNSAIFFSSVNITGPSDSITDNFHTGLLRLKILSKGDYVFINETLI